MVKICSNTKFNSVWSTCPNYRELQRVEYNFKNVSFGPLGQLDAHDFQTDTTFSISVSGEIINKSFIFYVFIRNVQKFVETSNRSCVFGTSVWCLPAVLQSKFGVWTCFSYKSRLFIHFYITQNLWVFAKKKKHKFSQLFTNDVHQMLQKPNLNYPNKIYWVSSP